MDPPHRRHREHRASSPVDFIADDEPLFVGAAPETLEKPRMYAGGIRSNPQRGGGSAGSIIGVFSGLYPTMFKSSVRLCSKRNFTGLSALLFPFKDMLTFKRGRFEGSTKGTNG